MLNKLFSLCMLVGILGSVYSFGRLTTGVNAISTVGFSSHKLEQWVYGENFFKSTVNAAITEAYEGDESKLAEAMNEVPNLDQCLTTAFHFLEMLVGEEGRYAAVVQRFSPSQFWLAITAICALTTVSLGLSSPTDAIYYHAPWSVTTSFQFYVDQMDILRERLISAATNKAFYTRISHLNRIGDMLIALRPRDFRRPITELKRAATGELKDVTAHGVRIKDILLDELHRRVSELIQIVADYLPHTVSLTGTNMADAFTAAADAVSSAPTRTIAHVQSATASPAAGICGYCGGPHYQDQCSRWASACATFASNPDPKPTVRQLSWGHQSAWQCS